MMRSITLILVCALAACGLTRQALAEIKRSVVVLAPPPPTFAQQVDLKAFANLAVHTEGRVKSYESFARGMMQMVSGSKRFAGQSPSFTYLDMMLRPDAYADADVIFVKNKLMRAQIAQTLRESLAADAALVTGEAREQLEGQIAQIDKRLSDFIKTGLISASIISDTRVAELLGRLSTDVLRGAKPVQELQNALGVMDAGVLAANLRLVAPPGGGLDDPWLTLDDLSHQRAASALPNLSDELRTNLVNHWSAFKAAWANKDAKGVNQAAAKLAELLPQVNTEIYPDHNRLAWESWYFQMHNMTWVWIIYAFTLVPLLLAIVFRWRGARWVGLAMFIMAFGLHTFAVMLRWYVADRWPNSNMFEAVTTAAWFGGCLAVLAEIFLRRHPMRDILALGSAASSMTALMAVHFLPLQLNPNIGNKMPVLHDIWLYIHTNVIIFSYCLIFMAAVSAGVYLLHRLVVLMRGLQGTDEYARVGGAGSLILTRPDGSTYLSESRSTLGQILDGTTMVLMELAFITLWAGLVMGAIWADHSWGRPWGWDPKEVFALNTFLVFLVLVHVRLKVKDKGLWTAILAVIGAGVMLFNWIIINFAISGLHSYA